MRCKTEPVWIFSGRFGGVGDPATGAGAAYGNRVLANSLRIKYSANSMADPARASASHTSCFMVIPETSGY